MSAETGKKPKIPLYLDVEGFRVPGFFTAEAFSSAIRYKPRPDDLFIVTYPKCGTTWVQNIVACIFRNGKSFSSAFEFLSQTPFLELTGAQGAVTMQRPGAIKLHLPFHLTPYSPEAKYIFIARNPKDCCVSFYHHTVNIPAYDFADGEFDVYFEMFMDGKVDFGDYFDTLLSWYEHRNDPNVLFITYEQIKQDTKKYVLAIAEFMGHQYKEALENDEKLLNDVIHYSSFGYMKDTLNTYFAELNSLPQEFVLNHPDIPSGLKALLSSGKEFFSKDPSKVHFVRKGIVGDWRNLLSPEQSKRIEDKFRERTKGTELADLWSDVM